MTEILLNICGTSKSKAESAKVMLMIMVMMMIMVMLQVDLKATKFKFKLDRVTENQELIQTRIRCCFPRSECQYQGQRIAFLFD
jgi:hypothetical protein